MPSIITIDARSSSAETSAFHIIQAVVVNHSSRSPGPQVPAQAVVLEVLEQDAAVAVHDRLRQAGGAGGEEDAERVVERHRLELERPRLAEQLVPLDRVRQGVIGAAGVGDVDDRARALGSASRISATSARRSIGFSP